MDDMLPTSIRWMLLTGRWNIEAGQALADAAPPILERNYAFHDACVIADTIKAPGDETCNLAARGDFYMLTNDSQNLTMRVSKESLLILVRRLLQQPRVRAKLILVELCEFLFSNSTSSAPALTETNVP